MNLRVAVVVVALVCGARPVAAQTAPYKNAVDLYRSGRYAEALVAFAGLTPAEIGRSTAEIRARVFDQAKRNPLEPLWVGAALVLQTHAMVSGDSSGSIGLDKLRDAVIWQAGDYTLIRCWYLFTISREQGRGGPVKAVHIFDDAPNLDAMQTIVTIRRTD